MAEYDITPLARPIPFQKHAVPVTKPFKGLDMEGIRKDEEARRKAEQASKDKADKERKALQAKYDLPAQDLTGIPKLAQAGLLAQAKEIRQWVFDNIDQMDTPEFDMTYKDKVTAYATELGTAKAVYADFLTKVKAESEGTEYTYQGEGEGGSATEHWGYLNTPLKKGETFDAAADRAIVIGGWKKKEDFSVTGYLSTSVLDKLKGEEKITKYWDGSMNKYVITTEEDEESLSEAANPILTQMFSEEEKAIIANAPPEFSDGSSTKGREKEWFMDYAQNFLIADKKIERVGKGKGDDDVVRRGRKGGFSTGKGFRVEMEGDPQEELVFDDDKMLQGGVRYKVDIIRDQSEPGKTASYITKVNFKHPKKKGKDGKPKAVDGRVTYFHQTPYGWDVEYTYNKKEDLGDWSDGGQFLPSPAEMVSERIPLRGSIEAAVLTVLGISKKQLKETLALEKKRLGKLSTTPFSKPTKTEFDPNSY